MDYNVKFGGINNHNIGEKIQWSHLGVDTSKAVQLFDSKKFIFWLLSSTRCVSRQSRKRTQFIWWRDSWDSGGLHGRPAAKWIFYFKKGSFVLFNQRLFRTYSSPNYIRDNVKPAGPWVMFRRSSQHVSCHITTSIDMSKRIGNKLWSPALYIVN
jgi:hypothetical protein